MPQVLLVRHAQSEWNAAGRWQGWADPPLTPLGRTQAETAGRRLARTAAPFTAAVSSDLDRARTTARIIAGLAGTAALAADPRTREVVGLRELDVGEWSGLTRAEIREEWPDRLAAWEAGTLDAAPGGEPRAEFDRRVRTALTEVLADHPDEQLLIVAHGGVVHSIASWLGAPPAPVFHVAGYWLEHERGRAQVAGPTNLLADEAHEAHEADRTGGADEAAAEAAEPDDSFDAR